MDPKPAPEHGAVAEGKCAVDPDVPGHSLEGEVAGLVLVPGLISSVKRNPRALAWCHTRNRNQARDQTRVSVEIEPVG